MQVKVYSEAEQKLFRRVLETKGIAKEEAINELIGQNLDEESAIIQWLKRNQNYDLYIKLKSTYAGVDNGEGSNSV